MNKTLLSILAVAIIAGISFVSVSCGVSDSEKEKIKEEVKAEMQAEQEKQEAEEKLREAEVRADNAERELEAQKEKTRSAERRAKEKEKTTEQVYYGPTRYVYASGYDGFCALRQKASVKSLELDRVYNGDCAEYLGQKGHFYRVRYNGQVGYMGMSACYIQ